MDKEDAENLLICLKALKWYYFLKSHMPHVCDECHKNDQDFTNGVKDLIKRLEAELVEENK